MTGGANNEQNIPACRRGSSYDAGSYGDGNSHPLQRDFRVSNRGDIIAGRSNDNPETQRRNTAFHGDFSGTRSMADRGSG